MTRDPIAETRLWIGRIVIGLNLCPFARRVFEGGKIRFVLSEATGPGALLADLEVELRRLVAEPIEVVETTILIHPHVLQDFLDYNDFVGDARRLLDRPEYEAVVQIADFHPQYRFAGARPNAVENHTNRSPYPMLHLLREESVTRVAENLEFLEGIPARNVAALRKLGRVRLQKLLDATAEE